MKRFFLLFFLLSLQPLYPASIALYVTVIEAKAFLSITVFESDGSSVEGAIIYVEESGRGRVGTGTTNSKGRAVIPVSPGSYDLRIEAVGFAPSSIKWFLVRPGENTLTFTINPLTEKREVITYPSPARDRVTFLYWLTQPGAVTIRVYNIALEPIAIIEEEKPGGWQKTVWDISRVAQGVCLYKIEVKSKTGEKKSFPTKKLAIVK